MSDKVYVLIRDDSGERGVVGVFWSVAAAQRYGGEHATSELTWKQLADGSWVGYDASSTMLIIEEHQYADHIIAALDKWLSAPLWDPEVGHSKVDDLLCELVEVLAVGHPQESKIRTLLTMYRDHERWYA